jgi:hypothetical protein
LVSLDYCQFLYVAWKSIGIANYLKAAVGFPGFAQLFLVSLAGKQRVLETYLFSLGTLQVSLKEQ